MPFVDEDKRVACKPLGEGFFRVILRYGFLEETDVPAALAKVDLCGPAVRHDADQLLPVTADADCIEGAWNGHLARKGFCLDAAQRGECNGVFQTAVEPRGRTGQSGRNALWDGLELDCRLADGPVKSRRGKSPIYHRCQFVIPVLHFHFT
jgi:hypothetical protein